MAKAGSEYNELARKMAAALEPNATVKMGQWIEGPDGKREVDVEVRGTVDEKGFFLLIECKDWKKPVDIEEIDKLDSKGKDLSADRLMICSNSGFTTKALRKARRLGMDAVSILAAGNDSIRLKVTREFVVKRLSVDRWSADLFPTDASQNLFGEGAPLNQFDIRELQYHGLPVLNWFRKVSDALLLETEGAATVVATFAFRQLGGFLLDGNILDLRGVRLRMWCSRKWLSKTVRQEVSLGYFDCIRKRVTIPDKHWMSLGEFDARLEGWEELSEEPEGYDAPPEPGTFNFQMTLMNPIAGKPDLATPNIDDIVADKCVETN